MKTIKLVSPQEQYINNLKILSTVLDKMIEQQEGMKKVNEQNKNISEFIEDFKRYARKRGQAID